METSNKPPTREEIRAGIEQLAEGLRCGALLGKALYDKERKEGDPPWEEATPYIRRIYMTCAVHSAQTVTTNDGT